MLWSPAVASPCCYCCEPSPVDARGDDGDRAMPLSNASATTESAAAIAASTSGGASGADAAAPPPRIMSNSVRCLGSNDRFFFFAVEPLPLLPDDAAAAAARLCLPTPLRLEASALLALPDDAGVELFYLPISLIRVYYWYER